MTAQSGCEQTGKREFRAWVPWRAQRHWIGYRDNQADALKAARRVWHSLRGDWSAGSDAILRDDFRSAFDKSVFQQDGLVEIIAGPHGDIRERDGWYVIRFRNLPPHRRLEIESLLESRWYGSREIHDGHLFAVGAGRDFLVSMGELIGAPLKRPSQPTEGLPKVAPKPLATKGLNRNVFRGSVGQDGPNRNAPINAPGCAHCGRHVFNVRARFCSLSCKQAAYRRRVAEVTP